jgi:hypothetical protein
LPQEAWDTLGILGAGGLLVGAVFLTLHHEPGWVAEHEYYGEDSCFAGGPYSRAGSPKISVNKEGQVVISPGPSTPEETKPLVFDVEYNLIAMASLHPTSTTEKLLPPEC